MNRKSLVGRISNIAKKKKAAFAVPIALPYPRLTHNNENVTRLIAVPVNVCRRARYLKHDWQICFLSLTSR